MTYRRQGDGPRQAAEIFQATVDLLVEHGYDGLTVEGVAARSGVNKTTIYRWYPSKEALLAAAMIESEILELTVADTGSLRGDLIALTEQVLRLLTAPEGGRVARAAIGGLDRPELAVVAKEFCAKRIAKEQAIFDRATARGELTEGADPALVIDLLAGAIWYRVLVRQTPMPDGHTEALVDTILAGLPRSS